MIKNSQAIEYIDNRIVQLKGEHKEQRHGQTLDVKQALDMELTGAIRELELIRKLFTND